LAKENKIENFLISKTSHFFSLSECEKTFDSISALYFHAAAIHYKKTLLEMYGEEFKLSKGHCTVCGSKLNSKQYYYIHMGSRHKVINQLMTPGIKT